MESLMSESNDPGNTRQNALPDTRTTMVMVLHHHQPAGNFDHVFWESQQKCYRPLLELLEQFPDIHVSYHLTGPLIEWIERHDPDYISLLGRLVSRGQIEITGGGFYEPILAMLSPQSVMDQTRLMKEWIERLFGHFDGGFWLAERVWETDLPMRLAGCRLTHTTVDDHHFHLAGFKDEDLHGYYRSSWAGEGLDLFPISAHLRYLIPFQSVEQSLTFLNRTGEGKVLTYADDAEKFGVWPETFNWVWNEGYLRRLFEAFSRESSWLRIASMKEVRDERGATGVAILPNASYPEMMEWAMAPQSSAALHKLLDTLSGYGLKDAAMAFVRGGIFEQFLTKYPDSRRLYHRMLLAERLFSSRMKKEDPRRDEIGHPLWVSQGNDVYWHGLFGGLYLSNLRHTAFEGIISMENLLEEKGLLHSGESFTGDFDQDGYPDRVYYQKGYVAWLSPSLGGSLQEIDDRQHRFHLTNTLTRQVEFYHLKSSSDLGNHPGDEGSPAVLSIHDRMPEPPDEGEMSFDPRPRRPFSEFLCHRDAAPDSLSGQAGKDSMILDLGKRHWTLKEWDHSKACLAVSGEIGGSPLTLAKDYRFSPMEFTVEYRLTDGSFPEDHLLAVEFPMTLLVGSGEGRDLWVQSENGETPASPATFGEWGDQMSTGFKGKDGWSKSTFSIAFSSPVRLVRFPIETVSLSEKGLERVYQGTLFLMMIAEDKLNSSGGFRISVSFEDRT